MIIKTSRLLIIKTAVQLTTGTRKQVLENHDFQVELIEKVEFKS